MPSNYQTTGRQTSKRLQSIKSARRQKIIHDMETTTVELKWGNDRQSISISTGASMAVMNRYAKDMASIDSYIFKLVASKTKH